MRYRTKPCEIEAVQFNGHNFEEIKEFAKSYCLDAEIVNGMCVSLIISTLEGKMKASHGDYIIKGLLGEFYPCKPDVFEKKYELIK